MSKTETIQHTRGPWRFMFRERDIGDGYANKPRTEKYPAVVGPNEEILFAGRTGSKTDEADGRVIAATLELLAFADAYCEGIQQGVSNFGTTRLTDEDRELYDMARRASDKARGSNEYERNLAAITKAEGRT